jgi:hypothetical protein
LDVLSFAVGQSYVSDRARSIIGSPEKGKIVAISHIMIGRNIAWAFPAAKINLRSYGSSRKGIIGGFLLQ